MRKAVAQTLAVEVLAIPIGMATGILTARYLGPADRGLLTLLLLLPRTITVFGNVGIDTASIYLHRREGIGLGVLLWNGVAYTLALSGIAAAVLWHWRDAILGTFVSQTNYLYVLIPVLTVPFVFALQLTGALARATGDFSTYNRRMLLEKVLGLVGVLFVCTVVAGTVTQLLLVFLAIPALVTAWLLWDLRRLIGIERPDLPVLRRTLTFGVKSYLQNLSSHIHNRIDLYLVAAYLTNAELAFYSIGASLAERILMIPNALGMVLYPKLVASTPSDGAHLTARAARNTVIFGIATGLPVLVLGRWLIQLLYGSAYLDAVVPMYILIVGVLFIGVTRILLRYMTSVDKHQYNVVIVAGAAVVNVALNFALIPRFGIRGAALSSLLTYTLQSVLALYCFRAITGISPLDCLVPKLGDVRHLVRVFRETRVSGRKQPATSVSRA